MSSRHHTEKDKKRVEQEKLQMILNRLLKEEENKYCADCEAKGPRWATWNLGVFLCIRCAGIHRNLGVHLSKVKSVNLDTWTPEQVQHMRVIGNSVGRAVYEATLPEHFRRPQTDSALEAFIRGKYEHKRYMMKDYVPAKIDARDLLTSDEFLRPNGGSTAASAGTDTAGGKGAKKSTITLDSKSAPVQTKRDSTGGAGKERVRRRSSNAQQPPNAKPDGTGEGHSGSVASALNDLVDLDLGGSTNWATASTPNLVTNSSGPTGLDDLLGLNIASSGPSQPQPTNSQPQNASKNDLSELNQDLLIGSADGAEANELGAKNSAGIKKTKNDILALYGSAGSQPHAPAMGGVGFNMPPTPQMPFNGVPGQMLHFNVPAQTNNWTINEPAAAYGNVQPPLLCDPVQQNPSGYVATPFGYVPVAQTQQNVVQFPQVANTAPNVSNLHLQAVQQQLASLQLQRTQTQTQTQPFGQQQDTLATSLWH